MQLEEIQNMLVEIQNSTFQTKILNVIMGIYQDINALKEAITNLQNKLNEVIIDTNETKEIVKELKERLDKEAPEIDVIQ